jgi:hypothetical protein
MTLLRISQASFTPTQLDDINHWLAYQTIGNWEMVANWEGRFEDFMIWLSFKEDSDLIQFKLQWSDICEMVTFYEPALSDAS